MADLNNVSLTGRLTRDAVYKDVASGLATFDIAVNGFKPEDTFFITINLWGKTAKPMLQHLLKGTQVGITGTLKQNRWEDLNCNTQRSWSISCNGVTLLGSKPTGSKGPEQSYSPDDIPF